MQLNYKNIILRHNKSIVKSRSLCDTTAQLGNHTFAVPVVAANMQSLLTFDICKQFDEANWFYVYHRIDGVEDVFQFAKRANEELTITSISVGVTKEWLHLIAKMYSNKIKVDFFTVDVAISYSDNILSTLDAIKQWYPDAYVICGNGATSEWVEWIKSLNRVDCIKVGIGVSAACRTRQFTGFGSSTVSSLQECVKAANSEIEVMSDGGMTVEDDAIWIGDIAKALVLGADFVMSGALFSQCTDSPSFIGGYYGNASARAKTHQQHIEGTTVTVVSNGMTIKQMIEHVQHSIKSSISYSGGTNIKEMKELTTYDYVS